MSETGMTEEEPSNKNVKEPVTDATKKNMWHLNGHNHLWKDCPNNPNAKKYSGTHYFKAQEQEQAGMPVTNEGASTKFDKERSELKCRKKHRERAARREVDSIDSHYPRQWCGNLRPGTRLTWEF